LLKTERVFAHRERVLFFMHSSQKEQVMKGTLFVAIVALSVAGSVCAQDSNSQSSSASKSTSSSNDTERSGDRSGQADGSTGTLNGTPPGTSASRMGGQTGDDAGLASKNYGSFDKMDTNHRGYLTSADVASNKNLSSRFAMCDKNGDGRLSRDEYNQCTASH